MADPQSISRRIFLRNTAAAGVVGATVVAPAAAEAIAVPADAADPVFKRYVAFLAHEHRAALRAMFRNPSSADENLVLPMFWLPEDPDVRCLIASEHRNPEGRARAVLHAAGLPIPPRSWF